MKSALIDVMALAYSAKFAYGKALHGNHETEIIFGFMRYLLALQKKFDFDQYLFCFDSKHSNRKKLYYPYKTNRNNKSVKIQHSQVDLLKKEILPDIGFNNIYETSGLEADDIIASLCTYKNPDDEYIIISRDGDLYQLINKNVSQYDYVSKKMITERSFIEKHNIHPHHVGTIKSITGCKSDGVPGIPGIGEKTAIKYIKNELNLSKSLGKIESNRDIIDRNKPLVILPFETTPQYGIVKDDISFESLKVVFKKYNFQSQLTERSLDEWQNKFMWIDVKHVGTSKLSDFF